MKRFSLTIILILILGLGGCNLWLQWKNGKLEDVIADQAEDIATAVLSTPDSVGGHSAILLPQDGVLVPKIVYRDTGSVKTVKIPVIEYDTIKEVDTVKVLVDYYSLKYFQDSITVEDVEIKVLDTLQKNSIFARKYLVKNLRNKDFYNTRKFYVGGTIGGSSTDFQIGPNISYADKNGNMFGGTYLLDPELNRSFFFSYSRKISLKKK